PDLRALRADLGQTRDRCLQRTSADKRLRRCAAPGTRVRQFQEAAMPYVTEDNLTDVAMERWKDIPDPRLRQIMQSLIKHLHGFVRDIEPTQAEWAAAIDWLTHTGRLCSQKRQEFILTSDVLGVSMLVDAINHRRPGGATPIT